MTDNLILKEIVIEEANKQIKVTVRHDKGEYTVVAPFIVQWNRGETCILRFPKPEVEE